MPYISEASMKRQSSGEKGKRSQNSKYSDVKADIRNEEAQQKTQKAAPTENLEPPTEDGQPLR